MTAEPLQVRLEQCLAFGRSDTYITARLGVDTAEIQRVRDHLEAVAFLDDDERPELHIVNRTRPTPRPGPNITHGRNGYQQGCRCPTCTQDHADEARAYRAKKRKAS